jgi:hypothetical protein
MQRRLANEPLENSIKHLPIDVPSDPEARQPCEGIVVMVSVNELLVRAKQAIGSGEMSLRAAAEDMAAAQQQGATQREIAAAVEKSAAWVNRLLQWRSGGYRDNPFGPESKASRQRRQQRGGAAERGVVSPKAEAVVATGWAEPGILVAPAMDDKAGRAEMVPDRQLKLALPSDAAFPASPFSALLPTWREEGLLRRADWDRASAAERQNFLEACLGIDASL